MIDAIKTNKTDIELVIKPHPSNDFQEVRELIAESGLSRWRVEQDSIYATIDESDFIISMYSTAQFIPAMAGLPVMLLHSTTQSILHQEES